jgi:DNA-binding transcriptional ArsR family regulator
MVNALEKMLSSKAKAEIFRVLFDEPAELYMRDIERKTGLAIGSVQQVLKDLTELDLVSSRKDGNRLYYSANRQNPLYIDIHNMVVKTVGAVGVLSRSLKEDSIKLAFIFGSLARDEEKAHSDIDLFVIGDIGLRKLSEILSKAKTQLGREINPHAMTVKEFLKRIRAKDHFVNRVLENQKLFVKGTEDELERMD